MRIISFIIFTRYSIVLRYHFGVLANNSTHLFYLNYPNSIITTGLAAFLITKVNVTYAL